MKRNPGFWMVSSLSTESGASAGSDDAEAADTGEGVCVRSTRNGSLTAPSRQHDAASIVPLGKTGGQGKKEA